MESNLLYLSLGFLAQGLFSARMLIQWIVSEKAKKVLSPTIFWQLSLLGSILLSIYGWARGDFAIIFGQFISYYIYIWNLNIKNHWKELFLPLRIIVMLIPVAALAFVLIHPAANIEKLFYSVPLPLLIFGSAGQVIFTLRFVYQWWYSKQQGESVLPATFWWLSLIGSSIIVAYAIVRKDPVLILGQLVGFITYSRNLYLLKR